MKKQHLESSSTTLLAEKLILFFSKKSSSKFRLPFITLFDEKQSAGFRNNTSGERAKVPTAVFKEIKICHQGLFSINYTETYRLIWIK